MQFYWMKERVKQKYFLFVGNQEAKTWGVNSQNITHHITIGKLLLRICVCQMPYLKFIIRSCTNGPMLCSRQYIRLKSLQTVLLCKGVIMPYVRMDTQTPQQYLSTYDRGVTWKPVRKKYGHTRSRSLNKLKTGSKRGRLFYFL